MLGLVGMCPWGVRPADVGLSWLVVELLGFVAGDRDGLVSGVGVVELDIAGSGVGVGALTHADSPDEAAVEVLGIGVIIGAGVEAQPVSNNPRTTTLRWRVIVG